MLCQNHQAMSLVHLRARCDCPQDCAKSDVRADEYVIPLDAEAECGRYNSPVSKFLRWDLRQRAGANFGYSFPLRVANGVSCQDIVRKDVAVLVLEYGADTVPVWNKVGSDGPALQYD